MSSAAVFTMDMEEAHASLTAPGAPFEMATALVRGEPMRVWKNAPGSLGDALIAARAYGDKTFLVYEEDRVSFDAFLRAVTAMAAELRAQGVAKGDRIAIAMRNLPEWVVSLYAAASIGAIAAPLNAWWTGQELAYALNDSGAVVLIADPERLDRLATHRGELPQLKRVYIARGEAEGAVSLEHVLGRVASWDGLPANYPPLVELQPDDDATILYTSGTTGKPKGALATHRNIMTTLMSGAFIGARTALRSGAPPADPLQQRNLLLTVPAFHVVGCFGVISPALMGGAKLVLMRKWDVDSALALIDRERITDAGGVPTTAEQLLDRVREGRYDLSSLRGISYGGAPSRPELVADLGAVLPNVAPITGWGMTETSGGVIAQIGADMALRPASCGYPLPVWDVRIVDESGVPLSRGAVGELQVKGPGLVKGYWNRADDSADAFVDGWLKTGDLARIDADGFCYIVDRAKDVIIRGGENIYCVEVENVLNRHDVVAEAALIGVPDRILGEEPVAFVSLRPGTAFNEAELAQHVRSELAAFKAPKRIIATAEPLPRNPAGKVIKAELRAIYQRDFV